MKFRSVRLDPSQVSDKRTHPAAGNTLLPVQMSLLQAALRHTPNTPTTQPVYYQTPWQATKSGWPQVEERLFPDMGISAPPTRTTPLPDPTSGPPLVRALTAAKYGRPFPF